MISFDYKQNTMQGMVVLLKIFHFLQPYLSCVRWQLTLNRTQCKITEHLTFHMFLFSQKFYNKG